jgi:hypothetical protein
LKPLGEVEVPGYDKAVAVLEVHTLGLDFWVDGEHPRVVGKLAHGCLFDLSE